MRTSECRHCHQQIAWCKTTAGRSMPIDPEPSARGNVFAQYEAGVLVGRVRVGAEPIPPGTPFMPHWATCPVLNKTRTGGPARPPKPAEPIQPDLFQGDTQ